MYSSQVRRLTNELPNRGDLPDATHRACGQNPVCGDRTSLELRVEQGIVKSAAFQCKGCVGAVAAAAGLTELILNLPVTEAMELGEADLLKYLEEMPAHKRHGVSLAVEVLRDALSSRLQS